MSFWNEGGLVSVSGRKVFTNEETGEQYSERTTTVPVDGKWYTFPTIKEDGSQMSEDEVVEYIRANGPIDPVTGEEFPWFENAETAVEYAKARSATRLKNEYAEGGAVMLKTDGIDKDPISGNDVPLGSTAKEVRDDVDARLSEGEYVLPADVVRFFGLEKIEEMVSVAKEGIKEMNANGRIGGEPAPMDDEEMMAQADMAFNQGGMVPQGQQAPNLDVLIDNAKARAAKDPEFAQLLAAKGITIQSNPTAQTPPANNMGAPVAMADGGAVFGQTPYDPADYQSGFNPYAHTPGFMGTAATGAGLPGSAPAPVDQSKMCGPGTVWDEEKQMCVPVQPETGISDDDGPATPTHDPEAWMKKYDYSDPDVLMEQTLTTLGAGEKEEEEGAKGVLGKLGGFLGDALGGGMLGGIIKNQKYAEAMANAEVLRSHGMTEQADAITAAANKYAEDNELKLGGFFDSTKTVTKTAMNRYGKPFSKTDEKTGLGSRPSGTPGLVGSENMGPARTTVTPRLRPDSSSDDDSPSHAEIIAGARNKAIDLQKNYADMKKDDGLSTGKALSAGAKYVTEGLSDEKKKGGAALDTKYSISGLNKGGLVQRRKK